jgi:hypothetical protein
MVYYYASTPDKKNDVVKLLSQCFDEQVQQIHIIIWVV